MADTWFPKATRRDGPHQKEGYASFPKRTLLDITGLVGHSMEGSLTAGLGELDNLQRRASWPFSNPKSGPLLQHYPLESVCWTNGSIDSNFQFVGVEHEGVAGELINLNQRQNLADLLAWLDATCPNIKGWQRNRSLWEHREMTQFGSDPTACPSNRIPWLQVLALMEDVNMFLVKGDPSGNLYVIGPGGKRYIDDVRELSIYGKRLTTDVWADADIAQVPDIQVGSTVDLQPVLADLNSIKAALQNLKLKAMP